MKLNPDDLRKLKEEPVPREVPGAGGRQVRAIVRVRESGYVPAGIRIRSRIDEELFTADLEADQVEALRADERVASVELSEPLRQID